jgi:hypothetical protein
MNWDYKKLFVEYLRVCFKMFVPFVVCWNLSLRGKKGKRVVGALL